MYCQNLLSGIFQRKKIKKTLKLASNYQEKNLKKLKLASNYQKLITQFKKRSLDCAGFRGMRMIRGMREKHQIARGMHRVSRNREIPGWVFYLYLLRYGTMKVTAFYDLQYVFYDFQVAICSNLFQQNSTFSWNKSELIQTFILHRTVFSKLSLEAEHDPCLTNWCIDNKICVFHANKRLHRWLCTNLAFTFRKTGHCPMISHNYTWKTQKLPLIDIVQSS